MEAELQGCCNCMIFTCWIYYNGFDCWHWLVGIAGRGIHKCP